MEVVGISDMETAAVAAGGVSGSKGIVGSAGRDLEAAGLVKGHLPVAAALLAAAVGSAAERPALVHWFVGSRLGSEDPADSVDQDPAAAAVVEAAAAAAAAAEERHTVAVLNGSVGAGYREAVLQQARGALGLVEIGRAHV